MKKILKNLIPPIILKIIKKKPKYGFFGDYKNWQEALDDSSGYNNPEILEKVKSSLLKVKNGKAVYERDSVNFDKIQYSWPLLTSLLWIASKEGNKLNLLDFGGSLGSSYFQNKKWLSHLSELKWNIVEQDNFIKCGKIHFEDSRLKFFGSIDECILKERPFLFFASGSIQYIENPHEFLQQIIFKGFKYIAFDRTTFLQKRDRLTVQKVRPGIYNASYPAWFLSEEEFLKKFESKYELWAEFDSLAGKINLKGDDAYEKGFIFRKN